MTKWISSGASTNNVSFKKFAAQPDEYLDYFQTARLITFEQFLQDKADGWVTATRVFHPKQKVKSPQQIAINFNNETGVATPAPAPAPVVPAPVVPAPVVPAPTPFVPVPVVPALVPAFVPLDPLGSVRLCRAPAAPLQVAVSRGIFIDNDDEDSDSDSDTNSTVSEEEDANFVNPADELAYGANAVPRTPLQAAARFPLSGEKHYFFKSLTYKEEEEGPIKHNWILGPFKTKSDAKKAQSCISKVLKSTAFVDTHKGELETYEVHFPFYQNHKSTTHRTTQQLDAVFAATLAHLNVPKRTFLQNISTV